MRTLGEKEWGSHDTNTALPTKTTIIDKFKPIVTNKHRENMKDSKDIDEEKNPGHEQAPAERPQQQVEPSNFSFRWTKAINSLRKPLYDALHSITQLSARNPKLTVGFTVTLSIAILLIGLATNFDVDVETDLLWTPRDSKPVQHGKWIDDEAGFPEEKREFLMFFHNHGENVALEEHMGFAFQALESVRGLPGYDEVCSESDYTDHVTKEVTCQVSGVTKFWSNDESIYRTDDQVMATMSAELFPDDGSRVERESLFGYPTFDDNGNLNYTQSFLVVIMLPDTDEAEDFEESAIDVILDLDDRWRANSTINLRVEVEAHRSFDDE